MIVHVSYLHKQEAGDDGAAALHTRLLLHCHPSLCFSERPSVQLSVSLSCRKEGKIRFVHWPT